jgi:hypothetical protein
MNNLLSLNYWFNSRPGSLEGISAKVLTGALILFLIGFVFFRIVKKSKNGPFYKIFSRFSSFSLSNFFIGLFLSFFSYELIPVLSSRFWYLLWILGMITWLVFIALEIKKIPEKKRKIAEEKEFRKYIP